MPRDLALGGCTPHAAGRRLGPLLALGAFALGATGCFPSFPTSTQQVDTTPAAGTQQPPSLLSAFYGLEALPGRANLICSGSAGKAGIPLIFPLELDIGTLQAADIVVKTKSGLTRGVHCVSPGPAVDPGEFRTILLMTENFSKDDPPAKVSVVGNLLDKTGRYNFKGQSIDVIPLSAGPTLILGEIVPKADWSKKAPTPGATATACPATTQQVVRAVWTGGVTRLDKADVGEEERRAYRVVVAGADGTEREIVPFALADLQDGDNNHDLCLDTTDRPRSVSFPAGKLVDPNGDPNPATSIAIQR